MLDAAGVEVVAHHLSGIVDAQDLTPTGSGEVHGAEGAATVRKAVQHVRRVEVRADDQTNPIDAQREVERRDRDRENLVDPARKSERCPTVDAGIEMEGADRGDAITVENHRPRRTRIVDARERVDLRHSQPLSHGVLLGERGGLGLKTGSKIK
jgi:hypothetical protein